MAFSDPRSTLPAMASAPANIPALPRRTLARTATLSGVGLFTAKPSTLIIHPVDDAIGPCGLQFRRDDVSGSAPIPANVAHVVPESRRTVLSADPSDPGGVTVQTVEHLLSALAGLGITDAVIDVTGPEIPIMDGSAKPFVDAILEAGVIESRACPSRVAHVVSPIVLDDGKTRIEAQPLPAGAPLGMELTYRLEYPPGAPIPSQEATIFVPAGLPGNGYSDQVSPARTFCLAQEAQAMRQMGLFTHLTPKEMLVIGPEGPIENAYRFENEPARHKLLDMVGDLALAGCTIIGRVTATRTGHAHNHAMAAQLAKIAQIAG